MSARPTQDRVLVHRALAGQRNGATKLVAKYNRLVTSHLARCVKDEERARDLAQESFLAAFSNLTRLRDFAQFRAWLMRIAQRSLYAYLRSPAPAHETLAGEAALPEAAADSEQADPLEILARERNLRGEVESLPEPYRKTLELRFYEDLPVAEVARRQGIEVPLAKYRIRHAIDLLKRRLEAAGITERDI